MTLRPKELLYSFHEYSVPIKYNIPNSPVTNGHFRIFIILFIFRCFGLASGIKYSPELIILNYIVLGIFPEFIWRFHYSTYRICRQWIQMLAAFPKWYLAFWSVSLPIMITRLFLVTLKQSCGYISPWVSRTASSGKFTRCSFLRRSSSFFNVMAINLFPTLPKELPLECDSFCLTGHFSRYFIAF